MFKDLKSFAMASMFSQMEEAYCDTCEEFVKFVPSERRHEKLRIFSMLEFRHVEYWIDMNCPNCKDTLIIFRGKEFPKVSFAKDDD